MREVIYPADKKLILVYEVIIGDVWVHQTFLKLQLTEVLWRFFPSFQNNQQRPEVTCVMCGLCASDTKSKNCIT